MTNVGGRVAPVGSFCSGTFDFVGCEAASSFAAQTIRSPATVFSEIVRAAMHWHSKYTAPFPVFVHFS